MRSSHLFICFMCISFINNSFCATICSEDDDTDDVTSKIRFVQYTGHPDNPDATDYFMNDVESILNDIDDSKALVIYAHGFREHPSNESVQTIVHAHLQRGDDNILVLDWSDIAYETYTSAMCHSKRVAKIAANAIDEIIQAGLDIKLLHIIGHSMGAQIAGFIGKYSNNTIVRITGLDPANPGYYQLDAEHIEPTDAEFVDIIHTDGGVYGAFPPTGTVDFFANGGSRPQPGCPIVGIPLTPSGWCSHWRSWRFYAESVVNDHAFLATECPSYADYLTDKCDDNKRIYYGYSMPKNIKGTYYFNTNTKSPYSLNTLSEDENKK